MQLLQRPLAKIIGVASLGLLALAVFVMLAIGAGKSTTRADSSITRSEFAGKGLGVTLPASAHEIYYLRHSAGRGDNVFYLRFDLDPGEIEPTVSDFLAASDSSYDREKGHLRVPLTSAVMTTPRKSLQPVSWWTPGEVKKGYYVSKETSDGLRIIVDLDQPRIYLFQNE